jgi:hypothetical protein
MATFSNREEEKHHQEVSFIQEESSLLPEAA